MTLSGIFTAIGLLYTIDKQAESILNAIAQKREDDWFKDSADVYDKLQNAQSEEELRNASKALADLISRL